MENLSWFILELYKVLNSIAHSSFQWMASLASYSLNISCYLLKLFSAVLFRVCENMVVILDNLHKFIPKLFAALNSIAHSFFQWMALLASYCLNVSYYLLELFPVVLDGARKNMFVILDNLCTFIPKLFEALNCIAHSFVEWMALLASYCLNVSYYPLELFSAVLVRVWENVVVILDNLCVFIPKLFEVLNNIAHRFSEWLALLAPYCLTFSCYLLELLSAYLARVWENVVVIMDNLRIFISMIFDTLISIRYWQNSCAILENLRWLISEIFEASNRFGQGCLEWIPLPVSYCFIFLCYLIKWFSVVLVSFWENMVALINNMRIFVSIIFEVLTSNGAINLANYLESYLFIGVFSMVLIIWLCYLTR